MNETMNEPLHHIPDAMLAAAAADALTHPFALLVAAHVTLCDRCRARLEAHHTLGGLVLEGLAPAPVSPDARRRALAALDDATDAPPLQHDATYPAPISALVGRAGPRWQPIGPGARQAILWSGDTGSVRLLSVRPGRAIPEHTHRGLELTLVLAGAFADESGVFRAGDFEVADATLQHTPRATDDGTCLCVTATDARLRFSGFLPRLLQPLFRV